MADKVKLVIEIPKDIYERCKEYKLWSYDAETLEGAVAHGIPLPKGHGRLIDADALKETFIEPNIYLRGTEKGFWCVTSKKIKNAPTIVEADNERD